jgi:hypothetical protein
MRRACAWPLTRGVVALRVVSSIVFLSSASAGVRADDWLAVLPACSMSATSLPALDIIYPQPDLPALIEAGDELVTRVRLPAALTPPPGVQQERALRGWFAELVGQGVALAGAPASHRHSLAILTVRPDSGSSLIYRIRVLVSAYVAPSVYSLLLRTPFGERWAELSVQVVEPGLRSRPASGPTFVAAGRSLALRVGAELWVSEACPESQPGFEAEVASTLLLEKRSRVALNSRTLPPMAAQVVAASQLASTDELGPSRLHIDNTARPAARQLLLLLPARRSLRVRAAQLALYPAGDLAVRSVETISGVLTVAAGADAVLELGPALVSRHALTLEPRVIASGLPTRLRVRGATPSARVAYDYGYGRSALAGPELIADFAGPLEQPLRALVLTAAGGGELVRQRVVVTPHRPPSCAIGEPERVERQTGLPVAPLCCLLGLVGLLKRRRTRRIWE